MKKLFFASIIFILLSFISARAEPSFSRGIDILRQKSVFCKSTSLDNTYTFSKDDFEEALGKSFEKIVIKSIPENCTLKFGVDEVKRGAVISKSEISALRCIPHTQADDIDISFNTSESFSDSNYTFRLCPHENDCTATPQSLDTFSAVSIYGTLPSENVKITETAENGTLTLSGNTFIYTPHADFSGEDSFSYKALTECGALSNEELVKIRVRRPYKNLYFSDMISNPAHAFAIKLLEKGALEVPISQNTPPVFNPDQPLTRADFTEWALAVFGINTAEKSEYVKEAFADENSLVNTAVTTAINLGILRGEKNNSEILISPDAPITLSEASVIVCRILAPEKEVFSQNEKWYTGALNFLETAAHIPSYLSPDTPLTRGEGALILSSFI